MTDAQIDSLFEGLDLLKPDWRDTLRARWKDASADEAQDAARWRELNHEGIARRAAESRGIVRVPVRDWSGIDPEGMPVPSVVFTDYNKYRLDIAWIDPECNTLESFVDKRIKEKKA